MVRIECWLVGSYDPTSHNTSTMLRLYTSSFLLCFLCFFALFPLFYAVFPLFFSSLLLSSSVFPLLSLFLCLVPLFFLYFLYLFLSTLSTTYGSYLRTVLRSSCLRSFTGRQILRRISILTTLGRIVF